MKERQIPFSAPMVRAILEGRKAQTRRVVKPQPKWICAGTTPLDSSSMVMVDRTSGRICGELITESSLLTFRALSESGRAIGACPYGVPGDLLWVREGYRFPKALNHLCPSMAGRTIVKYEIDGRDSEPRSSVPITWGRYRSSRFMPRWASRISLEITDVRVQRLQEISEEDAKAEGCEPWRFSALQPMTSGEMGAASPYRGGFACLWDEINDERDGGACSWFRNPWVWAITFKRISARKSDQTGNAKGYEHHSEQGDSVTGEGVELR